MTLGAGDAVIFSSRIIPGNERGIFDLMNALAERGVKIVTERDRHIHVSGHPCRDELRQMYAWAKPQIAIPVHGERRHLIEHAAFAKSLQVPEALSPHNGAIVAISADGARIVDEAPSGRVYLDGNFLIGADSETMRERRKLAFSGVIAVALSVDQNGEIVAGPDVRGIGLPEDVDLSVEAFLDQLADAAEKAVGQLGRRERRDEEALEEVVRRGVRREANRVWGKKPIVEALVLVV